ncbi:hypothetical protein, partial [Mesorhizobium sp. M7A.F.Ca.ET.027.02.1.1]|uniref:hypothetical protein n=1 Tax=Mesorhizobium sp. M7A.F.Ca.ET.027.02.1.1 TaxID=2496655 RepID=UPI0016772293
MTADISSSVVIVTGALFASLWICESMGETFSTVSGVRGAVQPLSVDEQHGLPAVPTPLEPPGQLVAPPEPGGGDAGVGTT